MTRPTSASPGTRSMFGSQVSSKRPSSASYGFGTGTREHSSKIFVSPDHARLEPNKTSPSPSAYTLPRSVGTQPDGRKPSFPQWAFGTAERFTYEKKSKANPGPGAYGANGSCGTQVSSAKPTEPIFGFGTSERKDVAKVFISEEHNKSHHGAASPGPAAYMLKGGLSKQDESKMRTNPAWVFGTGGRFKYDHIKRASGSPGPGAYTLTQSVGTQVSGTKASAPIYGFGTSDREHQAKCYLSPEHEKIKHGWNSPGPVSYTLTPSTGKQQHSHKGTLPAWGFGTASRWSSKQNGGISPGPGAYCV